MTTIVTRSGKGSPLTWDEADTNFTNLNTDKFEVTYTTSETGGVERTTQSKFEDIVSVKDFGAVGDGVTDDTAAIQAALDSVSSSFGGGRVMLGTGRYLIDSADLSIPYYVALVGPYERMSTSSKDWTIRPGTLIVNSSYSILVNAGSAINGCCVIRKGLSANVTDGEASFAGTAIKMMNADAYCGHNAVIGFQYGIYNPGGVNRPRIVVEWNVVDCINGIDLSSSYDISRVSNNHMFPFTSPTIGDGHLRSGVGIALRNTNDWTRLSNNYVYGYQTGYLFDDVNSVTSFQDGYDAPLLSEVTGPRTSQAITISGTSNETTILGFKGAEADVGIYIDVGASSRNVQIVGATLWANQTSNITVKAGTVSISNTVMRKQDTSGAGTMDPLGILADGVQALVRTSGCLYPYITTAQSVLNSASFISNLSDNVFAQLSGTNEYLYVRGDSGGVGRLYLENTDYPGGAYLQFLSSNGVACNLGATEQWRCTTTGMGIGTGLPRAKLHSLGTNIIGLGTGAIAATTMDDNAGPQVNIWLDEGANTLNFNVIYSGVAGDTGRTVKSGSIALT